jgi:DNA polymerase-3 subunit delta'
MKTTPFSQIIGHKLPLEFLSNTLTHGPVGHAYLFYGPEGVGKQMVAYRFAKALLCEKSGVLGDACDACDACRRFTNDNHHNFQLIHPEGAQGYKIDQLRELRRNVSLMAFHEGKRVYLLPDADKMKPEGANAILKTLEEPSEGVVLILVTSQLIKILPTIISRCQKVPFTRISEQELEPFLEKEFSMDPATASLMARLSEGSPGKSHELALSSLAQLRRFLYSELTLHRPENLNNALELPKKINEMKKAIEKDEDIKIDIKTVYDWMLFYYRDLLVYRLTKNEDLLINQDFKNEIVQISSRWSWAAIRSSIQQLEYLKWIASKNLNVPFCLETVFLRAYQTLS